MFEYITYACTFIVTLGGAGAIVISVIRWFRKPDSNRDERLKDHDHKLDNDNKRLKELEEWRKESDEAQKVMMRAMLALMTHAIDGNHTEELVKERNAMQDYLIGR